MSDAPNDDDVVNLTTRVAAKQENDLIIFPEVAGGVLHADVFKDGDRVGVVWMAIPTDQRPRAGIIVDPTNGIDVEFQDDFGLMTLKLSLDGAVDAAEFLEFLNETYQGTYGRLGVGPASRTETLSELRQSIYPQL